MGLTKQYLRYVHGGVCNIVGSTNGALVSVDDSTCAVTAAESVNFYNLRTKEKKVELADSKKSVTCLQLNRDKRFLAAGYADGVVRLYDRNTPDQTEFVSFSGHQKGVNCLAFSSDGLILTSGGKDSTIVLWDTVSESGTRLNGHKNSVTHLKFTQNDAFLISSSKDSFIKMWHLDTHSCFYTIVDSKTEIYSFLLLRNDSLLISASSELELAVYDINFCASEGFTEEEKEMEKRTARAEPQPSEEAANRYVRVHMRGHLLRQSKGRALQLIASADERIVACLGAGQVIDLFRVYTEEESKKRLQKKIRKAKRKATDRGEEGPSEGEVSKDVTAVIARIGEYKAMKHKVKWADFSPIFLKSAGDAEESEDEEEMIKGKGKKRKGEEKAEKDFGVYTMFVLCKSNTVQQVRLVVDYEKNASQTKCVADLDRLGHREDVRSLAVSFNNASFMSGGGSQVIVWNMHSLLPVNCLKDSAMNDVTSVCYATGDNHAIAATKSGSLHLFDLTSTELIETKAAAHEGAIWQIVPTVDKKGFVSGSADKSVKFWNYVFVEEGPRKRLSLRENRSISLPDECLSVALSPDGRLLLTALLDCTVSVYFVDSLKFFLSLYGHSLPVTSVTVSPDSKMAVSGSADKTIKIWGLDFGDCHRSFHAHDEAVSAVMFSPSEEMLVWSGGRDGKVKQWDASKEERVQQLSIHTAEVRALAQTSDGNVMVGRKIYQLLSASHDHSIRVWELTEEIIVLGEEEEIERENAHFDRLAEDEDVVAGESRLTVGETEEGTVAVQGTVSCLAAVKSKQSIASTEQICESVELIRKEIEAKENDPEHKPHPIISAMGSKSHENFLVDVVERVQPSNLERSLLSIPFGFVPDLLKAFCVAVEQRYKVELSCEVALFLIRLHFRILTNSREMVTLIDRLRKEMPKAVQRLRDMHGTNLAALQLLQIEYEEKHEVQIFEDATMFPKDRKKKKRERKSILKTMV